MCAFFLTSGGPHFDAMIEAETAVELKAVSKALSVCVVDVPCRDRDIVGLYGRIRGSSRLSHSVCRSDVLREEQQVFQRGKKCTNNCVWVNLRLVCIDMKIEKTKFEIDPIT